MRTNVCQTQGMGSLLVGRDFIARSRLPELNTVRGLWLCVLFLTARA